MNTLARTQRVLALNFDPCLFSRGGQLLSQAFGWQDPNVLMQGYAADLAEASGGFLRYEVVESRTLDEFPPLRDGFCYDEDSYLRCWASRHGWHKPEEADYEAILRRSGALEAIADGTIDEVWLWGPPYGGFWESTMAGPGAVFCNSDPRSIDGCTRRFVIMGFNYERGVGEMLENFGHRVESMLSHAFGSWRTWGGREGHAWDEFTAYEQVAPGNAGCGNVHFAPNSERDYDWGNTSPVWSTCDDWLRYPRLTGRRRLVECGEWGGGDIRAHHRWWLAHLPRAGGETNGIRNNWWSYVFP
jgi:hypothetical protein